MLFDKASPAYASATRPHNASVHQQPLRVAAPTNAAEVAGAIREMVALENEMGLRLTLMPQASGHGAGAPVDERVVLLDTSGLNAVSVDAASRVAVVGAGATWAMVNAAAEQHGLLGLAGSAPSVSVSGYIFGGGIGWLVRRDGLASGSLRSVHYIDGNGVERTAADDAPEAIDREAIWAFRGAGGVGIAHTLEIDLYPTSDLHAGLILWDAEALPALVRAWAAKVGQLGRTVSSSIAVLRVPPLPSFPAPLHGKVAIHLAIADPDGPAGAAPLINAMREAATPVLDTWGPTDAAGLSQIHLDPPVPTAAVGDARWLDASTPHIAESLLAVAAADDAALVMMEIRHVAGAPSHRDGAVVTPPGEFIYHAVAPLTLYPRERIETSFALARAVWAAADAGSSPGSWVEGAAHVPEALSSDTAERARNIADAIDGAQRISRSRLHGWAQD